MSIIAAKLYTKLNAGNSYEDNQKLTSDIKKFAKLYLTMEELEQISEDELYDIGVEKITEAYNKWIETVPEKREVEIDGHKLVITDRTVILNKLLKNHSIIDMLYESVIVYKNKIISTDSEVSCDICFENCNPRYVCPKCRVKCCEECLKECDHHNCPGADCDLIDLVQAYYSEDHIKYLKEHSALTENVFNERLFLEFITEILDICNFAVFAGELNKLDYGNNKLVEGLERFVSEFDLQNFSLSCIKVFPTFQDKRLTITPIPMNCTYRTIMTIYEVFNTVNLSAELPNNILEVKFIRPKQMNEIETHFYEMLKKIVFNHRFLFTNKYKSRFGDLIEIIVQFFRMIISYNYSHASVDLLNNIKQLINTLFEKLMIKKSAMDIFNENDEKYFTWFRENIVIYHPSDCIRTDVTDFRRITDNYDMLLEGYYIFKVKSAKYSKFLGRCSHDDCDGLYCADRICNKCGRKVCEECNKAYDAESEHICENQDIIDFREIKQGSKMCPWCYTWITKARGCDDMFCTHCAHYFSWGSGEKIYGRRHNPEAERYHAQRRTIIDFDEDTIVKWIRHKYQRRLKNKETFDACKQQEAIRYIKAFKELNNIFNRIDEDNIRLDKAMNRMLLIAYLDSLEGGRSNKLTIYTFDDLRPIIQFITTFNNRVTLSALKQDPKDIVISLFILIDTMKSTFRAYLPYLKNMLKPIEVTAIKDETNKILFTDKYEHVQPCLEKFIKMMRKIIEAFSAKKWVK